MAAQTSRQTDLKAVKEFFGIGLAEMKVEWAKGGLTAEDREEIAGGIRDGSLSYPDRQAQEPKLLLDPAPERPEPEAA